MAEMNDFLKKINDLKDVQLKKEPDLLFSDSEMIGIYQLKDEFEYLQFESLSWLENQDLEVDSDNYELVYATEPSPQDMLYLRQNDIQSVLDSVFREFNIDRPLDYPGFSLSASHIIAIRNKNDDGYETQYYYVDRPSGFKKIDDFGLKLYEKYNNIRKFSFTGQPLSAEMLDILDRTERGEVVRIDEINNTKEIKYCKTITENGIETIYLNNRQDKQKEIIDYINSLGSATELDSDGNMQYNGYIERDSRLDIVIGLPASGKSSAIVDSLSQEFHSRLIDNDMVKAGFTEEFHGGLGGRLVHQESKLLEKEIFRTALTKGENIVLAKVGGSVSSIMGYIQQAKANGYIVNLHFVDLQREKVYNRLLNRLINTGRYVEPELIDKYYPLDRGNLCKNTFETLKNDESLISGYSEWNNDVLKGERPILIDYKNVDGKFIEEGERNNERRQAEGIGSNSDIRSVGYGGYNGTPSDTGRTDENEFGRTDELQQTSSSVRSEEISDDNRRIREDGEILGERGSEREGKDDTDNRSNELDSKGTSSRGYDSRRYSYSESDEELGNEGVVIGRENKDGSRDVSRDTVGVSQSEQHTEESVRNTESFSELSPGEREHDLVDNFDFTDIFGDIPENIADVEFLKGKILTIMSGRYLDGMQCDSFEKLQKNEQYGTLKSVFDYIALFKDTPINLNDIYIETLYGTFTLNNISNFKQLPAFNMSNQNGVNWYTISNTDSNNDIIVFNDNDIIACKVLINGQECKVNTELVNPCYSNAIEGLNPSSPDFKGKTYRFSEAGNYFTFDITLYRDENDVYKFFIESTDDIPFASGTLNSIIDSTYYNTAFDRNVAVKVFEAFDRVNSENDWGYVCYDLLDKGLTEEYIDKSKYTFYQNTIALGKNSVGEDRIVNCDSLMIATDFARKMEKDTGIRPEIAFKKDTYCFMDLNSPKDLAMVLDLWAKDVSPYDYADRVEDKEENISNLQTSIINGDTYSIKNILKSYIDEHSEENDTVIQQNVDNAKNLLTSIDIFEKHPDKTKARG